MLRRERGPQPQRPEGTPTPPESNGGRHGAPTATPPPLELATATDPDALYERGMYHYQRREWGAALLCFTRLQEIAPNRADLDPLLEELRWFQQLAEMEPEAAAARPPEPAPAAAPRATPRWVLALLALVGVALLAITLVGGNLLPALTGGETRNRLEELYNQGQGALIAGDYARAREAFQAMLALQPDNPEAQVGLQQAIERETVAALLAEARAAVDAGDWNTARARLDSIFAINPSQREARELEATVSQQQQLLTLFSEAEEQAAAGRWAEAVAQLEQIRTLSGDTYRPAEVTQQLFDAYVHNARAILARPNPTEESVQVAVAQLGSALALYPRTDARYQQADLENQYARTYQRGVRAYQQENFSEARATLEGLRRQNPNYAEGQATQLLYQTYVALGDQSFRQGDAARAAIFYTLADNLPVTDHALAEEGLRLLAVVVSTTTPTPPPTVSGTPTPGAQQAVVNANGLNVRTGPGTNYNRLAVARLGDTFTVEGRTASGWLRVCCLSDGRSGWLSAAFVDLGTPLDSFPLITDIPTPPPPAPVPPTRTPTPVPPSPTAPPPQPQPTPVPPPTWTPVPPTDTPTPVVPTETPILPTDTPVPPTDTPTPIPPTDTPAPPTDTPTPPR